MKHNVVKYLISKEKDSYTQIDLILKMYIDGEIEKQISKYKFSDIEIFTNINKKLGNSIQFNFRYYNLVCTVDFTNEGYEYIIYPMDASIEELEELNTNCYYTKDFSINKLIEFIYNSMNKNSSLYDNTKSRNLRKKYKTIANICLCIPCLIIIIFALYVLILEKPIILDEWFLLVILIPLILWFIFEEKSKRTR